MKKNLTYLLFFVCLVGIFFNSFHATFKLFKQTTSVILSEIDIEEDETEKKELNEDAKLISHFENLEFTNLTQTVCILNLEESKLISMIKNVQGP
nr:hypothetical protein [Bacteroidia bacterium]